MFSEKTLLTDERIAPVDADTFDDRGPHWQESAGDYRTRSQVLDKGWYTVTWSLIARVDRDETPVFRAQLFGEDGQVVMGLPLDEEDSETVGHHTMTVNLPGDGSYHFQIHAEHVTWKLALLRIPTGNEHHQRSW
ncbi:hypothetical protein [Marininema halotolerans]|uniref:Uncharacterized protein n=1 Tax=Marininema halotolerans TaxID=1155944 RepID=A0A1I6SLX1_9BACL|nr:hypothetical protein [Marininema halotolerans]SFS77884.1 hypothetical protein SAMN05444972_107187 [Marininema halotolerans]